LGDLEVNLSDIAGGREREVLMGIFFGGTNMKVEAEIKSTGEVKSNTNAAPIEFGIDISHLSNISAGRLDC
jgi:hypothetical protein